MQVLYIRKKHDLQEPTNKVSKLSVLWYLSLKDDYLLEILKKSFTNIEFIKWEEYLNLKLNKNHDFIFITTGSNLMSNEKYIFQNKNILNILIYCFDTQRYIQNYVKEKKVSLITDKFQEIEYQLQKYLKIYGKLFIF